MYLGFVPLATLGPLQATGPVGWAVTGLWAASMLFDKISIGGGRKDADIIVPKQNELWDKVMVPMHRRLDTGGLTLPELDAMLANLNENANGFYEWINQPALVSDGDRRASDQAQAWLDQYYNGLTDRILQARALAPQDLMSTITGWFSGNAAPGAGPQESGIGGLGLLAAGALLFMLK